MAETIIYLDHAATTPLHPEVLDAMLPWLRDGYGNPGSLHRVGRRARQAVNQAREQVAALIGAEAREIVFTGSGSEADNLAIAGTLGHRPGALITSSVEHHAVLHAAKRHADGRCPVEVLTVNVNGCIDPADLQEKLKAQVALVSIMHSNNETGVLQPVDEIARICKDADVPFHCDAVQSVPHLSIDVGTWPVSMLSLSAHKLNGPKGVGALFVRRGCSLDPLIAGGGQEGKRRAGTENVAGIVGLGCACDRLRKQRTQSVSPLIDLRRRLEAGVLQRIENVWVNGGAGERLPHVVNFGVAGVEGEGVLYGLDAEGICVSTGSACTSGVADPSHVLRAMGQSHGEALSAVRFSLGTGNTAADIDRVLNVLPRVVQELRSH